MARHRSRSYSPRRRSRSPPRGRKLYRDDVDEGRSRSRSRSHRDGRSSASSGLLIRNLPLDARAEDLRGPFEKFGPVKDVYLPKNYYTGEPRGFGFVKYRYGEDAAEAKEHMNYKIIGGREIRIVFAEENRKTPKEMRRTARVSDRYRGSYRGRTPPRSPRRRYRSYSPSRSPARHNLRERRMKDDHSPRRSRSYSQSPPQKARDNMLNQKSPSPRENGSGHGEREFACSRSRSPSSNRCYSLRSRSCSRSRSYGSH